MTIACDCYFVSTGQKNKNPCFCACLSRLQHIDLLSTSSKAFVCSKFEVGSQNWCLHHSGGLYPKPNVIGVVNNKFDTTNSAVRPLFALFLVYSRVCVRLEEKTNNTHARWCLSNAPRYTCTVANNPVPMTKTNFALLAASFMNLPLFYVVCSVTASS